MGLAPVSNAISNDFTPLVDMSPSMLALHIQTAARMIHVQARSIIPVGTHLSALRPLWRSARSCCFTHRGTT